jgi:hypothetical protein
VVAAFFSAAKPRPRVQGLVRFQQEVMAGGDWTARARALSEPLRQGEHPVPPFHWPVEFPEVFGRDNPGFDAIVGNPPFAGKNITIAGNRANYLPWLQTLHEGAHGNADLVAHFFRRAFGLLRTGGVFGLIATNTIRQGDTRASGLTAILAQGGAILRAVRRLKWPGEAAVVVSIVHVIRGDVAAPVLDERPVRRISAYLVEGDLDVSPEPLAANSGKAFVGSLVLGMGFTFDDAAAAKGEASSLAVMNALIAKDPRNAERIFPYIGGEEFNTDPRHAFDRHVIDFADFPLRRDLALKSWFLNEGTEAGDKRRRDWLRAGVVPGDYPDPVAADWPDLLEIVERLVKPDRATNPDRSRREIWWRFTRRTDSLYRAIAPLERALARSLTSAQFSTFDFLVLGAVYDQTLLLWAYDAHGALAALTSRSHEVWARFFGATFKDDGRYNLGDCFRTFPFPDDFERDEALAAAGEAYHAHRAELMVARNEGLTKTYNRFHDRAERGADIERLRGLHAAMDGAVLAAYGWTDLAARAAPEFVPREDNPAKTRLDWPQAFKDEVLARLLDLNRARAAEEKALGLTAANWDEGDDEEDGSVGVS